MKRKSFNPSVLMLPSLAVYKRPSISTWMALTRSTSSSLCWMLASCWIPLNRMPDSFVTNALISGERRSSVERKRHPN